MLFFLGAVVSIACAVLFYRTAAAKGAPAIQWAVVGFGAYFLSNLIWSLVVTKPIATKLMAQGTTAKAALLSGSGILVGAAVAWLIWSKILNKLKEAE